MLHETKSSYGDNWMYGDNYDNNYQTIVPAPATLPRLQGFGIFKEYTRSQHNANNYSNYIDYDNSGDGDYNIYNRELIYEELANANDHTFKINDEWRHKFVSDWNCADTGMWIIETAKCSGIPIQEIPLSLFRSTSGQDLLRMSLEDFCNRMSYPGVDNKTSIRYGEVLYEALHHIKPSILQNDELQNDAVVPIPVLEEASDTEPFHSSFAHSQDDHTLIDLDRSSEEIRNKLLSSHPNWSPGYEHTMEETSLRFSENGSPQVTFKSETPTYMSDGEVNVKKEKRQPGRPRGSGKKNPPKRIKNVSVPEFLRNLLLDPEYCPKIIKWEDYSNGKFRFLDTGAVAKLWGGKRENSSMSFEKFSRAMRYHYKQDVLKSVPETRLVYQFGEKAPNYETDDPNFEMSSSVKCES